jgi:hypothetical protein
VDDLPSLVESTQEHRRTDVCLGIILIPGHTKQTIHIYVSSPVKHHNITRSYGGPPQLAARWGINISLDVLRKLLKDVE